MEEEDTTDDVVQTITSLCHVHPPYAPELLNVIVTQLVDARISHQPASANEDFLIGALFLQPESAA